MNLFLADGFVSKEPVNRDNYTLFTLAVYSSYQSGGETKKTVQYIDCITYINNSLQSGDKISIRGEWNKYKSGEKYYTNIKVKHISYIETKSENEYVTQENGDDNVPF